MIEAIVATLVVLVALALPGVPGVSPESLHEARLSRTKPPPCREPTLDERRERGLTGKGKAATFSIDGEWLCERGIFAYGERSSDVDFVAAHAARAADRVAVRVADLVRGDARLATQPVAVQVLARDARLTGYVGTVTRQALAGALGGARVLRAAAPTETPALRLTVLVREAAAADLLFGYTLAETREGGRSWRL